MPKPPLRPVFTLGILPLVDKRTESLHTAHEMPAENPNSFLLEFHQRQPGCTSAAYARGRCKDHGKSSYTLLSELPMAKDRVLDLGCGDGYLLQSLHDRGDFTGESYGLDFSEHELAIAQRRKIERAQWIEGNAHAIALPSHRFDWVLSHFAFHIIANPSQTIAEVARLLRPGGRFATIVGGGPKLGDAFELFLEIAKPQLSPIPKLGDPRCSSVDGLAALFLPEQGWQIADLDDHAIDLSGSVSQLWDSLSTVYALAPLGQSQRLLLRERFSRACAEEWPGARSIPCSMFVRRVCVQRCQ